MLLNNLRPEDRFLKYVTKGPGCWEWSGSKNQRGYGLFHIGVVTISAHRYAYEMVKGKIPKGLVIDHLCRNTGCVNPQHLEAVTQKTNLMRGVGFIAVNSRLTHCKHGHTLGPKNKKGHRKCKECNRVQHKIRYWREKGVEIE